MRTSTVGFQNLLNSQKFLECNLFNFTLITGQQYYWTDSDVDVTFNGRTYLSTGPSISGVKYKLMRGLQVDTMDLTVLAKQSDLIGGVTWNVAAMSGALDGTKVSIEYALLPAWGSPAEAINIFKGQVSDVKKGDIDFTVAVLSDADKLNTKIPKIVFQPGCVRTLYSPGCTVIRANFSANGIVNSVTNRVSFQTNLPHPAGYFSLGAITFLSGLNAGVRRSVKIFANGAVTLSFPLAMDLAPGDAFTISAGCDHSRDGANGCPKFANQANYKGTPFVPMPEAIL